MTVESISIRNLSPSRLILFSRFPVCASVVKLSTVTTVFYMFLSGTISPAKGVSVSHLAAWMTLALYIVDSDALYRPTMI